MSSVKKLANEIANNITDPTKKIMVFGSLLEGASCQDQVMAFHALYDCPIETVARVGVPQMDDDRIKLRIELIDEEFRELREATAKRDIVEMADALGDIAYVVFGFAIEAGIDLNAVIAEIHASNMTKLAADGSVIRRDDGKVLKGPSYLRPDIASVLKPVQ